MDVQFPLDGATLVVGPANVGKTRVTAAALDSWVADHGPEGCVVLDFAPTVERDGEILGGPLTQFTEIPDGVFHGVVDAHAPRAEGETAADALALAEQNAIEASVSLDNAPDDPVAVFVNDATIPLQADPDWTRRLTEYCDRAEVTVCNAFENETFGDDRVSQNERIAFDRLQSWADRVVRP